MGTGSVKSSEPPRRPLTQSGVDATQRRALNDAYAVGTRIGDKYRLVRALGEGGMATVWVAYNEALDIHVAIKFIRAELQEAVGGLDTRLLQEARAAARLGHPAIVRVSDFGKTPQGDPYIVMELLSGEDLSQVLLRGTLEPLRAVRTLLPIADALATAHENKIVHRDLKPGNIFLARTGDARTQPKLVDFGIAKLELGNGDQRITEAGRAMGSPAYMSPEQARVLDVDCRSDIWSLCVVLYEALTGVLPFDQPTYADLVAAILKQEPKPLTAHGVYEPELWDIIARGLQKEPDQRWENMRELGAALALWAVERGASDDVSGRSLLCTWVERPPDSLRGVRPSVCSLSDVEDGEGSGTLPAIAPPEAHASGILLAAPVEHRPPARSRARLIAIPVVVVGALLGGVLALLRTNAQASAPPPALTAVEQSAPTNVTPPAPPPLPVTVATVAPVASLTPSTTPHTPPGKPSANTSAAASAKPAKLAASAAPASSTTPAVTPPPKKSNGWDTDSPLPPE